MSRALAVGAALISVAIWANFLVTTGDVVGRGLGIVEIALMRSVVSAAALAPVLWRIGLYPKGLAFWRFAVMVGGAAAGFMFFMPFGFTYAPPTASGVFGPGTLPLWVAALSLLVLGERIGSLRMFGFFLIALGVLGVGGWDAIRSGGGGTWIGYVCFAGGSLFFSFYAIAQRDSGLTALEATALISAWSVPIAAVAALVWGVDFSAVGPVALGWTALTQFGSGVVAIVTYTYAIQRLGPSRGSAFIALTPAVVALASDLFLGLSAGSFVWAGVIVVSAGVLIASGVMERRGPAYRGLSAPLGGRLAA